MGYSMAIAYLKTRSLMKPSRYMLRMGEVTP